MKKLRLISAAAVLFGVFSLAAAQTSLSLEQCKALAAQNDPAVKNAALDVLAARAQKREALAEYFPSVAVNAVAFHALNPFIDIGITDVLGHSDMAWNINNYVNELGQMYGVKTRYKALEYGYGATVSLTQPLFAGGRIVNGNRLASLGIEAAALQRSLQERSTDESVEQKYWTVVSLEEKKITLASAADLLDSLYKDVCSALDAGLVTESDRLQVQLKRSELRSTSIRLSGGTRLAKMDLFNAIGVAYSAVRASADSLRPFIDDISLTDRLEGLEAPERFYVPEEELAAGMEETRLLALQSRAKSLEKKMALGEALPEVGVGAMYGYGKYAGDGKLNGAVYAMVKIPISQWGKTARKLERYQYQIEKAENEREYLDAQLILRARQLWINLTTAWEQMEVSKEAVELSRDSAERMAAQYRAGMVPLSELLQAQTGLRQSEDSYIDQCIAYRTALNSYQALRR